MEISKSELSQAIDNHIKSDNIFKDCFIALSLGILREPFINSDTKYIVFMGMLRYLSDVGYTEEQVNVIREMVNTSIKKFGTKNSFMG